MAFREGVAGSWVFSRSRHGSLTSRMKRWTGCGLTLYTHQTALASPVDSTKNQQVARVLSKRVAIRGVAVGHGPGRPGGMGRVSRLAAGVGLSGGDPHPGLPTAWRPFGRYIARPVSGRQGRPLRRRTICTPDVYLLKASPAFQDNELFLTFRRSSRAIDYDIQVRLANELLSSLDLLARAKTSGLISGYECDSSTPTPIVRFDFKPTCWKPRTACAANEARANGDRKFGFSRFRPQGPFRDEGLEPADGRLKVLGAGPPTALYRRGIADTPRDQNETAAW